MSSFYDAFIAVIERSDEVLQTYRTDAISNNKNACDTMA
jgi:hypothetical protein